MNRKILLTLIATMVASSFLARDAAAQLYINVDTQLQQYYLSGSATGMPFTDPDFGSQIFWDNGQPYDGGYTDFLSIAAFTVTGNSPSSFQMYLHGNGNVNGAFNLSSGSVTTLTGDSTMIFSYAGWDPAVIASLEGKAASGETVTVTQGSSTFGLNFAVVPEPTSTALIVVSAAGAVVWQGRRLRRRATTR